jgi:hypothetical protein
MTSWIGKQDHRSGRKTPEPPAGDIGDAQRDHQNDFISVEFTPQGACCLGITWLQKGTNDLHQPIAPVKNLFLSHP